MSYNILRSGKIFKNFRLYGTVKKNHSKNTFLQKYPEYDFGNKQSCLGSLIKVIEQTSTILTVVETLNLVQWLTFYGDLKKFRISFIFFLCHLQEGFYRYKKILSLLWE